MAAGNVEEFGTPLDLFANDGHFAEMCAKSSITREDIVRAQEEARHDAADAEAAAGFLAVPNK
jgi:hypothetical protein